MTARIRAAQPFPLLVADGLQWKGEMGSDQLRIVSVVLVTMGPAMGLSSGCFVGLELIEGES